jgi:hypothetical protein
VKSLPAFAPEGETPPFQILLEAANEVNGFKPPPVGEKGPEAPAQG